MDKQNFDKLELELARKLKQREKRRKKRMPVSGASVKKLQRLIIAK